MSDGTALAGKHAFITGGGHGIGGASAEVLATNGAKLTLTGRNMESSIPWRRPYRARKRASST